MNYNYRKAPFTAFEKEFLKEPIAPHASILESKRTDSDYNKRKLALWRDITQAYNDSPRCMEATTQQLKKLWLNMKSKARDAKSFEHQRKHTGGGPPIPDMAPEHESVLAIVPHIMPTIKVLIDSDGPGNDKDGDNDEYAWQPKRIQKKSIELLPKDKDTHISDTGVIELLPDNPPPSAKAVHAKSHRGNKNNGFSIDALKIELIEKDIEHRDAKFKIEIENQNKINDLKYKILLLEYEHKKKLFQLIEKEQEEKLRKASQ